MLSAAAMAGSVLTNEIFVLVRFLNSCYYTVTLWHCARVHEKFTAESRRTRLQKETFSLSLSDRLRSQHSADRLVKHLRWDERVDCDDLLRRRRVESSHLFKASLSESRALEVLDRSYFVCQFLSLLSLDGRVPVVRQSLESLLVFPQIYFGSWKQQNIFILPKYFYMFSFYLSIKWGHRGNDVWSQDTILR